MSRMTVVEEERALLPHPAEPRVNIEEVISHFGDDDIIDDFRSTEPFGDLGSRRNRLSDEDDFFAHFISESSEFDPIPKKMTMNSASSEGQTKPQCR